jgi:hypothetical protein
MPSIGAVSFLRVDSVESKPTEIVRRVTRPNVSGVALQTLGIRGRAFRLNAVRDYLDEAAFQVIYATLRGYISNSVGWENNQETAFTGLAILNVSLVPGSKRPIQSAVGGFHGANGTLVATFAVDCVDTGIV